MRYKNICTWLQGVVADVEGSGGRFEDKLPSLMYLDDKVYSYAAFIDTNIATLNDYIDGSADRAYYVTFRFCMPYFDDSKAGTVTNDTSLDFIAKVMDRIDEIDLLNDASLYPDCDDNEYVLYVECLDNDPALEEIDEHGRFAVYGFQLRIVYLDNKGVVCNGSDAQNEGADNSSDAEDEGADE